MTPRPLSSLRRLLPWQPRLGPKIFFSYLVVIAVGIAVAHTVVVWVAPSAFARHVAAMEQAVAEAIRSGKVTVDLQADLYTRFHHALDEALLWALLGAAMTAGIISAFVTYRITAPLRAMLQATQHIAAGHYDERVPLYGSVDHPDELTELALYFNRMADELARSEARRRQLIGDVAHELRTPLTTIKGYVEGLVDGVVPPEKETYLLICQEAERMQRLIDDLQELSRVESGAYTFHRRPIPLHTLLESAVQRLRQQFAEKGVSLITAYPADLPSVEADRDRLLQVLVNVLGNALRYTPSGGEVRLLTEIRSHEVVIIVADSGIGIPAEHLPHIFQRFYRVDRSRSRASGGSGIGLAIAKHLIEAHGGRIWAESRGQGQGSTFYIALPPAPKEHSPH